MRMIVECFDALHSRCTATQRVAHGAAEVSATTSTTSASCLYQDVIFCFSYAARILACCLNDMRLGFALHVGTPRPARPPARQVLQQANQRPPRLSGCLETCRHVCQNIHEHEDSHAVFETYIYPWHCMSCLRLAQQLARQVQRAKQRQPQLPGSRR